LDTSDVVVKVTFVANDGEVLTATKNVSVVRRTYPQNIVINGASDPRDSAEYTWSHDTEGVNGDYSVVWSLEGSMTSYWRIASSDFQRCVLEKTRPMPSSVSGNLKVTIVRNFDNGVASTGSLALSLPVVFPANATIIGNVNPLEKPYTYTWETTTEGVNGELYAQWSLSGDITSVVKIMSQDNEKCVMGLIEAPTEIVSGLLTLNIYKVADNSLILTVTKELQAMMEGIIMTNKTNPMIQAVLYSHGLVANETYTLKEEAALITASQLKSALMGIPYNSKDKVTQFDEFQYFTGVTEILASTFSNFSKLSSIVLPHNITYIGEQAFSYCYSLTNMSLPQGLIEIGISAFSNDLKLESLTIPESVEKIGGSAFYFCNSLEEIVLPQSLTELSSNLFYMCSKLNKITIPKNVTIIQKGALQGCSSLQEITMLPEAAPTVFEKAFSNTGNNVTSKKLKIISNTAEGYDWGAWASLLVQNGFTVHGKLCLYSNSPVEFKVTYQTDTGESKTFTANSGVCYMGDIKYDTSVTIGIVNGGVPKEGETKTFIYNEDNQVHNFTFDTVGSWINIDQTIMDPSTMITGNINGSHIQAIRNNSHRYLGKYTANGTMTTCQLDDVSSLRYSNGESAVLSGGQGDVFMKLPMFWYATTNNGVDKIGIGFYYGDENPGYGWKQWEGNELIGVYELYVSGTKGYSYSGAKINQQSFVNAKKYSENRGAGFSIIHWRHFNIMALLFLAYYGNTDSTAILGGSTSTYTDSGTTDSIGMTDTRNGMTDILPNFWGLEGWVGSRSEYLDGAVVKIGDLNYADRVLIEITQDGLSHTIRTLNDTYAYLSKIRITDNFDIEYIGADATSSTGYCTYLDMYAPNESDVLAMGYGGRGIFYQSAKSPNLTGSHSYTSRLAFRGTIIEESDPAVFKSLTAIG
jgi:hypothetical protein